MSDTRIIQPGATIGILGGGQLGRMLALAAAQLGYRCHVYAPEAELPAADVARVTRAAYDDEAALARFAEAVDVVTYEFENIEAEPIAHLAERVPLHPPVEALRIGQDRLCEKDFVAGLGGRPAPYRAVSSRAELDEAIRAIGCPAILKTRRFGYDGKGQARLASPADADAAWAAINGQTSVLEGFISFEHEFSVIVCRSAAGGIVHWDPAINSHKNGILDVCTVPASAIVQSQAPEAIRLASKVAEALDYVGVLTLEFFAAADGPVFNEMAPRVHNSGHWTIEGARTSQFENHIRAICGLPLGATDLAAPKVEMTNLIGDDVHRWREYLADPKAHVHLYGKAEARPGRKMGHVTRLEF